MQTDIETEVSLKRRRPPPAPEPEPDTEPAWWARGLPHPLDDRQFERAFCDWVFANTNDYTLRRVRYNAYAFIRSFMRNELAAELARYRAEYP